MREIAPDLAKSHILEKTCLKKKNSGVNISYFDSNILSRLLLTVPKPKMITFLLKKLFKSLRVQKKRRANFFGTYFFSVAPKPHLGNGGIAGPKVFYYFKV